MRSPTPPSIEHEAPSAASPAVIEIRKYPNRRLYDTSQSRHLTQERVLELVLQGKSVRICDSKTGSDITTIVLLQILIEHDPVRVAAIPAALVHAAAQADLETLRSEASRTLSRWPAEDGAHAARAARRNDETARS